MPNSDSNRTIGVCIPIWFGDKIEMDAKAQGLALSNYVKMILIDYYKRNNLEMK